LQELRTNTRRSRVDARCFKLAEQKGDTLWIGCDASIGHSWQSMRVITQGVLAVVARPRRRCGGRGCEQAHDGQSYDEAAQILTSARWHAATQQAPSIDNFLACTYSRARTYKRELNEYVWTRKHPTCCLEDHSMARDTYKLTNLCFAAYGKSSSCFLAACKQCMGC
jgi:hypothetical protein